MRTVDLARDIDHGAFSGLTNAEIEACYPGVLAQREADKYTWTFPDGESYADASRHADRLVEVLARRRECSSPSRNGLDALGTCYDVRIQMNEPAEMGHSCSEPGRAHPKSASTAVRVIAAVSGTPDRLVAIRPRPMDRGTVRRRRRRQAFSAVRSLACPGIRRRPAVAGAAVFLALVTGAGCDDADNADSDDNRPRHCRRVARAFSQHDDGRRDAIPRPRRLR